MVQIWVEIKFGEERVKCNLTKLNAVNPPQSKGLRVIVLERDWWGQVTGSYVAGQSAAYVRETAGSSAAKHFPSPVFIHYPPITSRVKLRHIVQTKTLHHLGGGLI